MDKGMGQDRPTATDAATTARVPGAWGVGTPLAVVSRLVAALGCAIMTGGGLAALVPHPAYAQDSQAWQPWLYSRSQVEPGVDRTARAYELAERERAVRAQVRELLRQAEIDLAAGRNEAAYQALDEIVERHPDLPEAGIAKDRLVEQFRQTRQTRQTRPTQRAPVSAPRALVSGPIAVAPPVAATPPSPAAASPASPIPVLPPIQVVPPVQVVPKGAAGPAGVGAAERPAPVQPWEERAPAERSATLRRGGDDFKQSVGDRIFFDGGTARMDARQRSVVLAQAAWLKDRPEARITLEGHADETGSREFNAAMARERAEAVRAVLVREGVAAERIEIAVLGNEQPVARCAPSMPGAGVSVAPAEVCASQNRRVVTVVGWADSGPRRRLTQGKGASFGGDSEAVDQRLDGSRGVGGGGAQLRASASQTSQSTRTPR